MTAENADVWVLVIPAPTEWINANNRRHWAAKASLTATWRHAAGWQARAARLPRLTGPVHVTAIVHRADQRRADAANCSDTVKAVIDGLVDAGVLPGDHDQVIRSTTIVPGEIRDRSALTVILRTQPEEGSMP